MTGRFISVNCIYTCICLTFNFAQLSKYRESISKTNTVWLVMKGRRGNLVKGVKFNRSGFDLEEATALSLKLKEPSQVIISLVSNPGAERQKHYVMDVCLLLQKQAIAATGKLTL